MEKISRQQGGVGGKNCWQVLRGDQDQDNTNGWRGTVWTEGSGAGPESRTKELEESKLAVWGTARTAEALISHLNCLPLPGVALWFHNHPIFL